MKQLKPTEKINLKSPYKDIDYDRKHLLNVSEGLCQDIKTQENKEYGKKNLIYFSVFGDGYLLLLRFLLESIHFNTPKKNFDIMIICDEECSKKIIEWKVISCFRYDFMIVNTPEDGVDASINKCKIFSYNKINTYNKILFVDCDMLALKDVNIIFDNDFNNDILYTVYNKQVGFNAHSSYTHGLSKISKEFELKLEQKNQRAFNAGQFLLKNSTKMKNHFNKILWLINNWPSSYFFEQSFMVTYFCRNFITEAEVLNKYFEILIIPKNQQINKFHSDETVFIHFAGPPLNSDSKINYIYNYRKIHNI